MKISKSLKQLHDFLSNKEKSDKPFSKKEILDATGWKEVTLNTYIAKGQFDSFINKYDQGRYKASNCKDISKTEFARRLSQSKHLKEVGFNCKSKLAKALLKKSRDNMLLALELYNRPSLENKMDGFVMCFCTAWEQLLKAYLIEKNGEISIYKNTNKKGLKETISLRESLDRKYPKNNFIRKNVKYITDLRDNAVHLLMPEIQGVMSRIFQSGVLNYSKEFETIAECPFLDNAGAGMMSLVADFKSTPISVLSGAYGKAADEIIKLVNGAQHEVETANNIEFAIPLNVKLTFATEDSEGETIFLAKAEDGVDALRDALIVEKPVDRAKSHPYLQKAAIKKINAKLLESYGIEKLQKHLVSKNKDLVPIINQNCFLSVVSKNKWKNSNNEFHYKNDNPELHYYSEMMIDQFILKIMEHEYYLQNAKNEYNKRKSAKLKQKS